MNRKTKIAIIGTVGLPANYGGFETLAEHLVAELGDSYKFTVYCSSKKYARSERQKQYKGARLLYLPLQANGVQSILYDTLSILHALFFADVLIVLGVSGCFMLPLVRLFSRRKIITSIDGIEWKRAKWNKVARLFLWAAEWMAVKSSHASIADNESIQDYTAIRYGSLSSIIEYGADHTMRVKPARADKDKYPFLRRSYAFKVCRVEPENNVHLVLEAFSRLPNYEFVMVGNWNNSLYGRELRDRYAKFSNISLLDPIYNQQELDVLRGNCFVYVHGHSAGGTNPSLVEAMYLGLPVIAFKVSYNKTTTEQRALYFSSSEELEQIITSTSVADFTRLGQAMKEIADRRYNWQTIARKYAHLVGVVTTSEKRSLLQNSVVQRVSKRSLIEMDLGHLPSTQLFYEKR